MKRIIFISIILLGGTICFAQKKKVQNDPMHDDKRVHFGFTLGLNVMDYRIEMSEFARARNYYVGLKELAPGVNIHAISNFRLSESFDLRVLPGISFGERYIYFINGAGESIYEKNRYKMETSYLEMPISIKYKSQRINNFRPYILAGFNTRYDLAIKKEYDYDDQLFMAAPLQYFLEFGGGADFYLPSWFKLGVEIKYSLGLNNIMRQTNPKGERFIEHPEFSDCIKKITSNMLVISFHFE